jgi:hypothetical protein
MKLAEARAAFHKLMLTGDVQKTGWNPHTKSKFWELGDIVTPALMCFQKAGIVAMPMTCKDPDAIMELMDAETGETYAVAIPLGTAKLPAAHDIQNKGAVLSYCRRYLWMQVMECVDVDVVEQSEAAPDLKPTDPATEKQMNLLRAAYKDGRLSKEAGETLGKQLNSGKKVTVEQASSLIESMKLSDGKPDE